MSNKQKIWEQLETALDGGSKTSASVQQTHRRVYYQTSRAPVPKAPLSQAVRVNDTLYISGQVGVELETGELARGVKEQTELIFIYLGEILATAGAEMDNIVRTTVYMKNIQDLRNSHEDVINIYLINDFYKKIFTERPPARTAIEVSDLPIGALVEIEAIAVIGDLLNDEIKE